MIHFNIFDQSDNKRDIAYAVLPLNCIRPGYRFIPLKVCALSLLLMPCVVVMKDLDIQGSLAISTLFVLVEISVYVPDEHADFMIRLQNPTVGCL